MSLTDSILAALDHSTPQQPMYDIEIVDALIAKDFAQYDILATLDAAVQDRLLGTARITRGGVVQNVYWPTGLKTPALAGIKPKEPLTVPTTPIDTMAQKLIKAIVAHGPIINSELAEKTGAKANNIDSLLKSAVKNGQVTTRQMYVAEQGRDLRYWMTATQAQEWDAREMATEMANDPGAEQIEIRPVEDAARGHVMSHPEAETLRDLNAEIHAEIHALRNDLAARNLILLNLARTLQVQQIEDIPAALDELTHALATRAITVQAPTGKKALLLIDSADLTEVEMLGDDDDAQAMAMSSIELGHAARVMVVHIVGEAQRKVVWKEAA